LFRLPEAVLQSYLTLSLFPALLSLKGDNIFEIGYNFPWLFVQEQRDSIRLNRKTSDDDDDDDYDDNNNNNTEK
jgi:hypothetical protein